MPGLRAPSEYSQEPPRHPSLVINSKEPFNAERPHSVLVSSYVTPVDLFYKRNHGPIPLVDDLDSYCITIVGLIESPKRILMTDLWALPKYNVTATLQASFIFCLLAAYFLGACLLDYCMPLIKRMSSLLID